MVDDPLVLSHRARIVALAAKSRLPARYGLREFVDAGGLMSYATNLADSFRRAATYVDKIPKGAKPADLPVEQPTRFEPVINLNDGQGPRAHDPAVYPHPRRTGDPMKPQGRWGAGEPGVSCLPAGIQLARGRFPETGAR